MQKVLVLHDFMMKDKKLNGSKLLVYAFIYSYSQIPGSKYVVYWKNAIKFLGISKSSYFDSLKWLIDNRYIKANDLCLYEDSPLSIVHDNIITDKVKELTLLNGKYYTNEEVCKIAQYKWVK